LFNLNTKIVCSYQTFQEATKLLFPVNILQLQGGFTPFTLHSFLEGIVL